MVIYDLTCERAHRFEGWFSNRGDFERQLSERLVRCPICDSPDVSEKPSAPKVHVGRRTQKLDAEKQVALAKRKGEPNQAVTQLRAVCEAVKRVIDDNFDDVGERFADEAIAMFVGDEEVTCFGVV